MDQPKARSLDQPKARSLDQPKARSLDQAKARSMDQPRALTYKWLEKDGKQKGKTKRIDNSSQSLPARDLSCSPILQRKKRPCFSERTKTSQQLVIVESESEHYNSEVSWLTIS